MTPATLFAFVEALAEQVAHGGAITPEEKTELRRAGNMFLDGAQWIRYAVSAEQRNVALLDKPPAMIQNPEWAFITKDFSLFTAQTLERWAHLIDEIATPDCSPSMASMVADVFKGLVAES